MQTMQQQQPNTDLLRCTRCGDYKPPEAFHRDRRLTKRGGRGFWCKQCKSDDAKLAYASAKVAREYGAFERPVSLEIPRGVTVGSLVLPDPDNEHVAEILPDDPPPRRRR